MLRNYKVPEVFSKYRITIHIPRGPYVDKLPGIPTIRPFEALACKIPLISAPWIDSEKMFTEGKDFLFAENKTEVGEKIKMILSDSNFKESLKENGLRTILKDHTCKHRAEQLIKIFEEVSSKKEMVESKYKTEFYEKESQYIMVRKQFGFSILNGAATYYRGMIKELHKLGHTITFYEPDAFDRQKHRDIEEPEFAKSIVYQVEDDKGVKEALENASKSDIIIKASGVGIYDELLEREVLRFSRR